ncbi:GNAT family N-acetyltransferase [Couchioplanes azureus]|uniref:GNAT family N-acetyltransferase n=1 Tax=Couchioplanes caeruleus TaxID=56438 RepID=UPI001E4FDEF8|nr:GNAT family N-acetyltransferase [Couchioplanes caeruleus]
MNRAGEPALTFRLAEDGPDLSRLVAMRDAAARWQIAHGIAQWRPGELTEAHFRERIRRGEVWLALRLPSGRLVGAWELWWKDPVDWGPQPPCAGYVHRLMTDRAAARPGTGRVLLEVAERRIAAAGRLLARLSCAAGNARLCRYYAEAGYHEVGRRPHSCPSGYPVALFEKPVDRGGW